MRKIHFFLLLAVSGIVLTFSSCDSDTPQQKKNTDTPPVAQISVPRFQKDSAYAYIQKQVDFGPRVPGSDAHKKCGDWMVQQLKSYGFNVIEQTSTVTTYDGKSVPLRNIIGEFNPAARKRIALAAHWDTRPFADKDSDESLWKKPIDGANDGASGVGVLLEIARLIAAQQPSVGIDILFFDVEDYGSPEFYNSYDGNESLTWCLGSQYWMRVPHKTGYFAQAGILLDMVGAKDATFNKEGKSMEMAIGTVGRVWSIAESLGYGGYFRDRNIQEIVDDHQFMNFAGVPTIDIIDMRPSVQAMGLSGYEFGGFHHTHNDNMSVIDKNTLDAVGTTVTHFVYKF
ncbi:MAG: M28 family peptidase [Flavobacteriales bacterium]